MSKDLSLMAEVGMLSIVLSVPTVGASAHHARHRIRPLASVVRARHCHARYHHVHRIGLWRKLSSTHGLVRCSNQGRVKLNAIRVQLIKDIELSRLEAGVHPLKVTTPLQKAANYRVTRNRYAYEHYNRYRCYPHATSNPADNWIHGADTHTTAGDYFTRHGYDWHCFGSNAGCWDVTEPQYEDGHPVLYGTSTRDAADNFDDEVMSHDDVDGNHNGHRVTELSPEYRYLGVSVRPSRRLHGYVISEQFAR